jgi:competence protein ComEA
MLVRGGVGAGLWVGAVLFCVCSVVGSAQTVSFPKHTVAEKIAASRDPLDINTATAAELRALPGMGDAYVQRVIAGRPYTAKNQLTTRGILPAEAYAHIKDLIIAHRPAKRD